MIPLRDQEALRQRFTRDLSGRVRIDYFSRKPSPIIIPGRDECVHCEDVRKLLLELAALSPRISLTQQDIDAEPEAAAALGVDRAPGIVVRGQANRPLRFFGIPGSNQFVGFVETLIDAARPAIELKPEVTKHLRKLKSDVSLQVMVAPGCPYSPALARAAMRFGLHSVHVKTSVVEINEYAALIQRYGVRAVPLTIIDNRVAIPGALDEATLAENLLLVAEGKQAIGGGPVTPLAQQQNEPRQQRTSASGLIIPR
jgi:alkyl hydroperoxide reductase subunit AhpF